MKELHQYVDVTEEDLKKIYKLALKHAKERFALAFPLLFRWNDGAGYVINENVNSQQ